MAVNLPLLVRPIDQSIIVLHLRLLLSNLDHVVQICHFHRKTLLLLFPVNQALVRIALASLTLSVYIGFLLTEVRRVDGLRDSDLFELGV